MNWRWHSKLIQGTALTVLQLDMSRILHHRLAPGVRNAAAPRKKDHGLPMMKRQGDCMENSLEGIRNVPLFCQQDQVFIGK